MLSNKIFNLEPSATLAISAKAREMRANGIDIISLSAGEPDFDTPLFIKQAAKQAIDLGKTKYTNVDGITELKQAVSNKFKRDNNLEYSLDEINISPGGKAVIYNALLATLNAGDEVIIPAPCWVSYPEMVKLAGGVPVICPCNANEQYLLKPEALQAAITDNTKWLVLNSPNNPTGAVYSAEDLTALARVLEKHPNIMVLSDDIYEHLVYDKSFATLAACAPQLKERILTMNGVSKAYAMTGWRIGYAGGPKKLIAAMAKIMGQTTSNPCTISQWASLAALTAEQDFLITYKDKYKKRRDYLLETIAKINGLTFTQPDGAFYVFVNCEKLIGKTTKAGSKITNDIDFANALLDEAYVATVPGSAFHAPNHIRLSFACSMLDLTKACERMHQFCSDMS